MTDLASYTTDEILTLLVSGTMPNSCFVHAFGDPSDPETFFDPTAFNEVKLKATQGAAGGAGAIVLQQLRK